MPAWCQHSAHVHAPLWPATPRTWIWCCAPLPDPTCCNRQLGGSNCRRVDEDCDRAIAEAKRFFDSYYSVDYHQDMLKLWVAAGSPTQCVQSLQRYVEARATAILLRVADAGHLYTTNAIEALNAKLRRAVRARGHFPSDEAATKRLFLVLKRSEKEWIMPPREWAMAKSQFAVLFGERFTAAMG